MKESKFNKLFDMVMQWASSNDITGRIAFSPAEAARSNQEWPALENGKQVLDYDGNPVYWEVMAPAYNGYDKITGQPFKKNSCIVLSYTKLPKSLRFTHDKGRVYVLQSTYENAYDTNDVEMIEKLKSMGLGPGFNWGLGQDTKYNRRHSLAMEAKEDIVSTDPIKPSSIFVKTKKNEENPLCGKTYKQLKDMSNEILKNKNEAQGTSCKCPVCGKKFISNGRNQAFCDREYTKSNYTRNGQSMYKRGCSTIWHDTKKALKKQYPASEAEIEKQLLS